jgi:6-phosphogluconolactonase
MAANGIQAVKITMEHFFETREEASIAAAHHVASVLANQLQAQPEVSLVVGGGSSPGRCFNELSQTPLEWRHIHILLSDERWVAASDDNSNEKLVRDALIQSEAKSAKMISIYAARMSIEARCELLQEQIRSQPFPFAFSLLGMGEDGHFASLFPDADNLEAALDLDGTELCMAVETNASSHVRLSLTLAALSRSKEIGLLFFGDAKRQIYERAKRSTEVFPVSRLLLQKRAPVHVFWAP